METSLYKKVNMMYCIDQWAFYGSVHFEGDIHSSPSSHYFHVAMNK